MEYRKLPHGEERISILGLGTSSIGMAGEKEIAATVELALDEGTLMGGGKTLPFAEMEVDLKSGEEAAATAFAEALAQEFNLTPEPKSKAQRAMELLH